MKLPMKIVVGLIAVFAVFAITQVDFSAEKKQKKEKPKEKIVEKAFHTKNLSTFVTALKTAGLVDELNKDAKITIFAPSDSAFAALPEGRFAELMHGGNTDELKKILSRHVVADSLTTASLENGQILHTLAGEPIYVTKKDDQAKVNGAPLVKTNIEAANGVIHVIDEVMIPVEANKAHASLKK